MAEKVKKDGIKGVIGGGLRLNIIGRYEEKIMRMFVGKCYLYATAPSNEYSENVANFDE